MAGRSCSFLCLCLLFLVGHAVGTAVATAAAAQAPGHDGSTVAEECLKTVLETPVPCARDVIKTLILGTLHLSKECCAVLAEVGEKCVVDVFTKLPFGAAYLPIVKGICGLISRAA